MFKKRYLTPFIVEDLKEKMVFVSGPRQVGKTTISRELVGHYFTEFAYFNWDLKAQIGRRFSILGGLLVQS